jgi:hypothetical protein
LLLKYKNGTEPIYKAVDRMAGYYNQDKAQIIADFEQAKKTIAALYDRIHQLEKELEAKNDVIKRWNISE